MEIWKKLGLLFASLVLVLAAAELAVRATLGPVAPRNVTLVPKALRADPPFEGVPFVLRPHAEVTQDFGSNPRGYFDGDGLLTYRTNALGLRGPETTVEKPPGTFRIVAIGDSFTFGTGVREEDLFVTRLSGTLPRRPGAAPTEVLNLGVMGFNTAHEVALLRHFGLRFDPDLVLLCFVLNDTEVIRMERPADAGAAGSPTAADPGPRSLLLAHVRANLESRRLHRMAVAQTLRDYAPGAPGWVLARRSLAEARALADEHGFALVLVIFPNMWELSDRYPFAEAHAAIAEAASRLGIPVLDLFEAFRGRDGVSLWVHPTNQHPNEEAHAVAAGAIATFLEERRLLGRRESRGSGARTRPAQAAEPGP